ncbi:S41 family peptidase [Flavobacterium sp. '19STA2R22 D10 B1']|uniref:S41 family peptidase n=1 Tax=Flavobacterium aerium TaxID=3037261 RepID=UPI00278C0D77|nr:S41 family peptidase [Flavobacterium sp. '19STA2R22 D10 B1']
MKKYSILVLLLFITTIIQAQVHKFSNQELTTLCKVWGVMKYYQPAVSQGELDWDAVLIKTLEDSANQNVDDIITDWFSQVDKVSHKTIEPIKFDCESVMTCNYNMNWITKDKNIKKKNKAELFNLTQNPKNIGVYYSNSGTENFKFESNNEKTYAISSNTLRVLDLFRIWNAIEYFYPYKYLLDQKWEKTLEEYIPLFKNCSSELEYKKLIMLLSAEIQDTHVSFKETYQYDVLGKLTAPFAVQIVDNGAVITKIKDDGIAKESHIEVGDFITKIDNESIQEIIKKSKKYFSVSNESVTKREAYNYLFSSNAAVFEIEGRKMNGTKFNTAVKRIERIFKDEWDADGIPDYDLLYKGKVYDYLVWNEKENRLNPVCQIDDKAYVEFASLQGKEIDSIMTSLQNAKGIVFDLRGYNGDGNLMRVFNYLFPSPQWYGIKTYSDFNQPGKFCFVDYIISEKYKLIGKDNPNYYKGQVVVLINEYSQSVAELWAMMFKKVSNVIFVGSQTAGADGIKLI